MDLIKTGFGISRTIKNVGRLREIATILARNGFDELIRLTALDTKLPGFVLPKSRLKPTSQESFGLARSIGQRLRLSLEELGPGFIKLGIKSMVGGT